MAKKSVPNSKAAQARTINRFAVACDRCDKPIYSGDRYSKTWREFMSASLPWVLCDSCCEIERGMTETERAKLTSNAIIARAGRSGREWQHNVASMLRRESEVSA